MRSRDSLFDDGASAATAYGNWVGTYLCPICGQPFDRAALESGKLSREHVPPRALGGRVLLLTCRVCNSFAGHTADAEAAKRRELLRFGAVLAGSDLAPQHATLTLEGKSVNVAVRHEQNAVAIKVLSHNNPEDTSWLENRMRELSIGDAWKGFRFNLSPKAAYNQRLARVSALRSAFLVCTSVIGYTFAFSLELLDVRRQIMQARETILPQWWCSHNAKEPAILVDSDNGVVIVVLGDPEAILLPWPPKKFQAFASVSERMAALQTVDFRGTVLPLPSSFEARLDHLNALRSPERRPQGHHIITYA